MSPTEVEALKARLAEAEARLRALHVALARYGSHRAYCARARDREAPCECGLAEALVRGSDE